MKDETMIYEGICKYCGQITPVLANTQKEADMLVTEECDCTGADAKKRKEAVEKKCRTNRRKQRRRYHKYFKNCGNDDFGRPNQPVDPKCWRSKV